MKATQFQSDVRQLITHKDKPSLLLVAPTGLGKTFAVTGDLQDNYIKTVYAVPLRALGNDIHASISKYKRNGNNVKAVVHHGGIQDSTLFGEEVVVTTYDQVVCGVPGLPLSLPLKAGHAVAGALLMSRLIFDEAHLAWGISEQALSILFAIIQFRSRHGLQTILQTATLPDAVSDLLVEELGLKRVLVGNHGEVPQDDALTLRDKNRVVHPKLCPIKGLRGGDGFDFAPLDTRLTEPGSHNRIYFANTVDRLQHSYDRLIAAGVLPDKIMVLHNRMPHGWRNEVESKVRSDFGEGSKSNGMILLTNQVAEAGLNISAALVISDPAPVDTLVQRAGRCARWFRSGSTQGHFVVLDIPGLKGKTISKEAAGYVLPYVARRVSPAIQHFPDKTLSWDVERQWVNSAWGGGEKEAILEVKKSLDSTAFALNLFDRAAQENQPGEIANAFREILSIEVAIEQGSTVRLDDIAPRNLQEMLDDGQRPDTASISMGRAQELARQASNNAVVIRYEDGEMVLRPAHRVQLGDVLILPSSLAYLHRVKGLCFNDSRSDAILSSEWRKPIINASTAQHSAGHRQTLSGHTLNVMKGACAKLTTQDSSYREALYSILRSLEGVGNASKLLSVIAQFVCVAVAFHDLGKADTRWQNRVRELDPGCPPGLIGRSISTKGRIGFPHTPPGYVATVEACRLLMGGDLGNADFIVRAVALAASRHHSSLFQPANVQNYAFTPHGETVGFVQEVLRYVGAPHEVIAHAGSIIEKSKVPPQTL